MASFTLDDIRSAADRKYASTDITVGDTVCKLVNPVRLPKERRDQLSALQDLLGEDGADQVALLSDALRVISENDHQANTLLGAIGGDLAVLAQTFESYGSESEVGEA